MQFNYAKYLFVLAFLLGGFFIYKIFFLNITVDDHGHLHHQAHVALHTEEYDQVIYLCDKVIEADHSSPAAYQMYIGGLSVNLRFFRKSLNELGNIVLFRDFCTEVFMG